MSGGTRMNLRRPWFVVLVLVVIGLDLWWSGTPSAFEIWWIPLIVVNAVCLILILLPMIRGKP